MAEVWEDLQCAGFGIYRDTEGFSYGHDAVLLANFVRATRNDHVLDLGAGTGIVSFLVHAKTGAGICAADISERCCRLMEKSVAKTVEFGLTQNDDGTFCIKSMKILSVKSSNAL